MEFILEVSVPYADDDVTPRRDQEGGRFVSYQIAGRRWLVWDSWWVDTEGEEEHFLSLNRVLHQSFNVAGWYHKIRNKKAYPRGPNFFDDEDDFPELLDDRTPSGWGILWEDQSEETQDIVDLSETISCCAQRPEDPDPATVQRNATRLKGFTRKVPRPIVVVTKVNGQPTRALLDSGSLGDFISTTHQ